MYELAELLYRNTLFHYRRRFRYKVGGLGADYLYPQDLPGILVAHDLDETILFTDGV